MTVNKQQFGTPYSVTNGSITVAIATVTAGSSIANYVTDISGSSTLAGSLLSLASGTTILWEVFLAANTPYQHTFSEPIGGIRGDAVTLTVGSATATSSRANIAGFILSTP